LTQTAMQLPISPTACSSRLPKMGSRPDVAPHSGCASRLGRQQWRNYRQGRAGFCGAGSSGDESWRLQFFLWLACRLWLSKTSKCLSGSHLYCFRKLFSDAHFSHDTPRCAACHLPFARCPRTREFGFASSNRRASAVGDKTPEIDRWGPHVMGPSVPRLARLALGAGHRSARDGRGLASCRFSPVLDLEGAPRTTGTVSREVRDLIRRMCRENPTWGAPRIHGELLKLGINLGETSVSKYMVRSRKPPSQTWRTFLENRLKPDGLHRLLHCPHYPLPGSLRVSGTGP